MSVAESRMGHCTAVTAGLLIGVGPETAVSHSNWRGAAKAQPSLMLLLCVKRLRGIFCSGW